MKGASTLAAAHATALECEARRRSRGRTLYVLDEPTTGLHAVDVDRLLIALHRLVDGGDTAVVIERDLDVIKTADWLIDIGRRSPGRPDHRRGHPEQIAADPGSHTGRFLHPLLEPR
ncbi:hypothetical protein AB0L53_54485 [Nonomuraea sp. NPDC052129]|uniref:hypothetical protein n=1 Tax=Nonomuraea sp. NPDC052129 TaxID=3154651 RepID=UPI003418A531